MLGVVAWWKWLMLSWAFFLLMPWLINHFFARFYSHTLIDPAWRIVVLQEARKGRWKLADRHISAARFTRQPAAECDGWLIVIALAAQPLRTRPGPAFGGP